MILTEVMAQIGWFVWGIYLLKDQISEVEKPKIALTSNEVDFSYLFFHGKVKVISEKSHSRFNKPKMGKVQMFNAKNEIGLLGERLREC